MYSSPSVLVALGKFFSVDVTFTTRSVVIIHLIGASVPDRSQAVRVSRGLSGFKHIAVHEHCDGRLSTGLTVRQIRVMNELTGCGRPGHHRSRISFDIYAHCRLVLLWISEGKLTFVGRHWASRLQPGLTKLYDGLFESSKHAGAAID